MPPIHEYECGGCGNKTEFLQNINEKPKKKCPKCKKFKLRKIISSGHFHLKGDGWYDGGMK